MALSIDRCGGSITAISVARALKQDGERGDANMVMSVMCKKINEEGKDQIIQGTRKGNPRVF